MANDPDGLVGYIVACGVCGTEWFQPKNHGRACPECAP